MVKFIDNLDEAFEEAGIDMLEVFTSVGYNADSYSAPFLIVTTFKGSYNLEVLEGMDEYNTQVQAYATANEFVKGGDINTIVSWAQDKFLPDVETLESELEDANWQPPV